MNRATMVGFLILGLAFAGLAVAQFTQPKPPPIEDSGSGNGTALRAPTHLPKMDDLEREVEVLKAQLDDHQAKIRSLETALAQSGTVVAPVPEGDAPAMDYPVSANLEQQVEAILEKRDEKKRKAELERRVERMAGFFLRDINVSEDQRKQFNTVVAAFWDERGKLMQQEYATADDRRAATDALAADRDVKLQQILDAGQFAQVSERLDRMNRGGGGGGRPTRGGRGGGGR